MRHETKTIKIKGYIGIVVFISALIATKLLIQYNLSQGIRIALAIVLFFIGMFGIWLAKDFLDSFSKKY